MRPAAFLVASVFALGLAAQETTVAARLSGAALIDRHVTDRWAAEGVKPAPLAGDDEWLRRVYLDVVGVIPPADVAIRFIADRRPDKRTATIDALLADEQYAQHWADRWETMLLGYDGRNFSPEYTLNRWLREEAFARNMPYDEMARHLIGATGSNLKNGASIFLIGHLQRGSQPTDVLDRTARVFLGTQIQCAQCHDHPFDRYTQEDYYSSLAFFIRTRSRKVKPEDRRDFEYELFEQPRGEAVFPPDPQAKNRRAMPPRSLDGLSPDRGEDRRAAFARILTRTDNLQFARALVNRYWGHFLGRGLVHPIEEFNLRNKPSHPELLNELAQDFVNHKFDLKWLIRAICGSRTYGLASKRSAKSALPEKLFSHALVRAMTPEQLYSSIIEAVGIEDRYDAMERSPEGRERVANERRNYTRQFRFTFGDDEKVDIIEFHGTVPQALMMLNGDLINQRMRDPNGRLDLILRTRTAAQERLDLIYLSALSRYPTPAERARFAAHLTRKGNQRPAYEDVLWVLLNSSEFMFIH